MDSNTIKEIANQLGIATDAVTKEVIPAYAQFEIGFNVFEAILFGCLFILVLTLTIYFMKKGIIEKRKGDLNQDYDSGLYFLIGTIAGLCATIFFVLLLDSISAVILWVYSPYGSFVNMILAH